MAPVDRSHGRFRSGPFPRDVRGRGILISGIVLALVVADLSFSLCVPPMKWERSYNSPANMSDTGIRVAVDGGGNAVVAGSEERTDLGESFNWLIRRYNSNGGLVWSVVYNSPANGADEPYDVTMDSAGNVIAVGYEMRSDLGQGRNWLIRKYSPGGSLIWSRSYDSPFHSLDEAAGVATDSADNVIVVGHEIRFDLGQSNNWLIRKYDSAGSLVWSKTYDSPASDSDLAHKVEVDSSDNIYVFGREERPDLLQDVNWRLIKYDSGGNSIWSVSYNSPGNGRDWPFGIGLDLTGNIIAAGWEAAGVQGANWRIRKYNSSGVPQWSKSYNGPANGDDVATDVIVRPGGEIVVAGWQDRSDIGQGQDWRIAGYDSGGNETWASGYNSPANGQEGAWGLAVSGSDGFTVAGWEDRPDLGQGFNWRVRHYRCDPAALVASVVSRESVVCQSGSFVVTVSVSNTGDQAANGVVVAPLRVTGTGSANLVAGPTPVMPVTLGAGTGITFTWTYSGGAVGQVSFSTTVTGTDAGSAAAVTSGVESSNITTVGTPGVLEAQAAFPSALSVGHWATVALTVTNTGGTGVTGVAATLAVGPGPGTIVGGPAPAGGPFALGPGAAMTFSWTYSPSGTGRHTLTGTATGLACTINPVIASSTTGADAELPAALAGAVAVSSSVLVVGQWVAITMTVTNTGGAAAEAVTAAAWPSSAGLVLVNGPVPVSVPVLASGSAATFSWTFSASGSGPVVISGQANAADGNSGYGVSTGVVPAPLVVVVSPAALSAQLSVAPAVRNAGQVFTVTLDLTNTGGEKIAGVNMTATWFEPGGTGVAGYLAGPTIPFPVDLDGGASLSFTWTHTALASGWVDLTTTLSGTAAITGAASFAGPVVSNAVVIQTPATLDGSTLTASPDPACVGRQVRVVLTVTNAGEAPAVSVIPLDLSIEPQGGAAKVSGPATTVLAGGATANFTWVYAAGAVTTLKFTTTVTGQDGNDGTPITTGPSTSNTINVDDPAVLASAVSVYPSSVIAGQWVTVTLTVTNAGSAGAQDATGVTRTLSASPALAVPVSSPPAIAVNLPRGSATMYTWTFSTTGAGNVIFEGMGAGTTCGGEPVSDSSAVVLSVFSPAALVVDRVELSPGIVNAGVPVAGVAVVRNAGGVGMTLTDLRLALSGAATAGLSAPSSHSPPVPVVLGPGATTVFSWSHTTTLPCGVGQALINPSGTEDISGRALGTGVVGSNIISVAGDPVALALSSSPGEVEAGQDVSLTALLTDACGIGVPGGSVLFSVLSGGGSVAPVAGITDAGGQAGVIFTLGIDPGPNMARADLALSTISATVLVTGLRNPLALDGTGAALSTNVIEPRIGDSVLARIAPAGWGEIVVKIYTASGRLVETLRQDDMQVMGGGQFLAVWDGRTEDGAIVARGVYLIHVMAPGVNSIAKIVVK